MKRILTILGVFAAVAIVGGYLGLSLWARGETIKLKATATILVDGVERSGSAVQEFQLQWIYQPQIGRTGAWRIASRGEAIRIDVPGGEPIYVLMSLSNDNGNYGFLVESQCTVRSEGAEAQRDSFVNIERCDLETFPKTIRFPGGGDYDTAIAVFTADENRNGYRFVSMAFEKTSDPISEGQVPSSVISAGLRPVQVPYDAHVLVAGKYNFKQEEFR